MKSRVKPLSYFIFSLLCYNNNIEVIINMFRKKDVLRKKLGQCPVCGCTGWSPSETFTNLLTCPVCKTQLIVGGMEAVHLQDESLITVEASHD